MSLRQVADAMGCSHQNVANLTKQAMEDLANADEEADKATVGSDMGFMCHEAFQRWLGVEPGKARLWLFRMTNLMEAEATGNDHLMDWCIKQGDIYPRHGDTHSVRPGMARQQERE